MGRILVIEDEPSTQVLLQSRLQDLGHTVVIASNGAMGLMECGDQSFDLFLVDVNLGEGIDGFEVCKRLKSRPQTHAVPVVMITGKLSSREDFHRGYEAGCESFLMKGDFTLLEDVVRAMLRLKALQDELALQNQLLEQQNYRLHEEQQRGADLERALRGDGPAKGLRATGAGLGFDGLLLVDGVGIVRFADRGVRELFSKKVEGLQLGSLARGTGLEAFVRDARTEARSGFHFDVPRSGGRRPRSLVANVVPLSSNPGESDPELRAVLILDASKRKVVADMLALQGRSIPRREVGPLIEAARRVFHPSSLRGESTEIAEVRSRTAKLALSPDPVLITGDLGVGKQLAARALHFCGTRTGPFIPISCGTLSAESMEAELFGSAGDDVPGLLRQAHLGTIYFEDVDQLPLEVQQKLRRTLAEGSVRRVGSSEEEVVDVRVIASTTRQLKPAVETNSFDGELYYAISTSTLHIPPLRERIGDLPAIVSALLGRFGEWQGVREMGPEAMWVLMNYDWPENVRELEACVRNAATSCSGGTIGVADLPQRLRDLHHRLQAHRGDARVPRSSVSGQIATGAGHPQPPSLVRETPPGGRAATPATGAAGAEEEPISLESYEKRALLRALEETGWDKQKAAKLLNVGKSTIYRKLKRYGIK